MYYRKHRKTKKIISATLALTLLTAPYLSAAQVEASKNPAAPNVLAAKSEKNPILTLRLMETTDLHTNLLNYDYYKDATYEKVGLAKTAALVKEARGEVENSVLVDNGDLIQGTPLGTFKAKIDPLLEGEVHPVFKAMNQMDYDIATLGNHEFNYGLDFLEEAYDDANFPYINANVYVDDHDNNPENDQNKFTPYKIINKKVVDDQGKKHVIKIGYIGFVPPQISEWDKANLDGNVITKSIVDTAEKFIPQMREEGADIIIAMTHSGFSSNKDNREDVIYALTEEVPGIDAVTFSHTHKVFPAKSESALDGLFLGADKKPLPGVDNARGTINGVPAVQAGYGGGSLGIIDLQLKKEKGKWSVVNSQSSTREIYKDVKDPATGKTVTQSTVAPVQSIVDAVKPDHDATIEYVNTPIGKTTDDIHSYFSLVQDDPSVQVVTNAQKWYVENYIAQNKPELQDLPILSVGAPFKAGRNGVDEYTEIKKGDLTIRSAGDLYLYDNTLKAIKVKGSVVKEWIEMTAGKFNQIDPAKTEEQQLLNSAFQVFNFDIIDGVQYQIDVTQAPKYDPSGNMINSSSSRVVNLTYNGQPVDLNQDFIVVTNNYRAGGGGNFPGVKGSELIVDSADENRQILMDYISEVKEITPTADQNWSIAPINGDVNVTFTTSPKAEAYINEGSNISFTGKTDSNGFGIFKLNIGQPAAPQENVKVQLLGLNDLHGQLDTDTKLGTRLAGSMEYTAAAVRQREATNENTLLVHSGDMIGGSPLVSALFQDEPTVEVMEAMGFDVGTLGNHEFDEGLAELQRMIHGGEHPKGTKGYDGMNFPVVAANAYDTATGELITEPYAVKEVGGAKIGFIGVVTQETPNMIVRKGNESLQVTDEVEAIDKYTAELKGQGIEAIVVLAHNPAVQNGYSDLYDATAIAEKVDDEVDVVFAAHNHAGVDKEVDGKLVVQAYSYGSALSDVDIEIDPVSGEIVKKEAEIVTVYQSDYTPDPVVTSIMQKYENLVAPMKAEVVGSSAATLAKGYPTSAGEFGDLALGNLIADGMKAAMNSDFALMNGGGVRAQLDAGEVTFGDLFAVQPFGNVLNKVKLSGADLETVLNNQITWNPSANTYYLDFHIAGFKYTWNSTTGKVTEILLPDGSKIDPAKEYTVVVNNYMTGNLKYGIGELSAALEIGPEDLQATVDYVKTLPQPFEYKSEGRIQKVQ